MNADIRKLERTLAYHCGPSLSGVKPADLISWRFRHEGEVTLLLEYGALLARQGIRLRVLQKKVGFWLLLVYRPALLEGRLTCRPVSRLLEREGYPIAQGTEAMVDHLALRLEGEEFPHEVGLFLGYPVHDVVGFCRHRGRDYKLSGLWRVYGQEEVATRLWQAFRHCRDSLCRQLDQGMTLAQLLPAV